MILEVVEMVRQDFEDAICGEDIEQGRARGGCLGVSRRPPRVLGEESHLRIASWDERPLMLFSFAFCFEVCYSKFTN